ncbi:Glycosyltransferase involved in cell wall bisynthesis [Kaistella treverensis]|uniref:Glycosyltransferase involved in cell wall bisynthesis n=1 Tax=Kaistella treverensis TaxID=631455 RepID=A0A1I3NKC6_9FLAO|nr:glycosyltransferase [Kaistella treverensis]SFJ09784.1 Glycosyltransferase involved in cell wall bisynthesis [Kaistella treverensis]
MRITIVIADIRKAGGTERAIINMANMLCAEHLITVVSISEKGSPFFCISELVQLEFLNLPSIPRQVSHKPKWNKSFYNALKNYLIKSRPQIIFGAGHNISLIMALLKIAEIKKIALEHIDYTSIPKLSQAAMRWFYPKLDAVVVLSETAKRKIGHLNPNVEIIANTLPFSSDEVSRLVEKKIILVGRISKEKGYDRIIPIAERMCRDYPDWCIYIYGQGEDEEKLRLQLNNSPTNNVHIMTPVKNIKEVYLSSSLLLMTSYYEAMPMVILEAQHCGLPVLGYSCEGTDSLVEDGVNGFVVQNEEDFYKKLGILINNHHLRLIMGRQGRKNAELYNPQNILKKWTNFLEKQ